MSRLVRLIRSRTLRAGLVLGVAFTPSGIAHAADAPVTNSGVRVAGITPSRSLDGDETAPAAGAAGSRSRAARAVPGAAVGQQSVLVVRLYYTGEGWDPTSTLDDGAYSVAEIQDRVTGGAGSARAMYAAQSAGQVTLKGASSANADVVPTWFTFSGKFPRLSDDTCDANTARDQVQAEATSRGLQWQNYSHVVIVFPALSTDICGWSGLGEVPGKFVWVNGLYDNDALVDGAVIAHEIGHNLGLAHAASLACTTTTAGDANVATLASTSCKLPTSSSVSATDVPMTEYGDPFDMMGTFSYGFAWRGTELLSSWRRAQSLELAAAGEQTVTTAGTYTLQSAMATSGTRLIRIARGTGGSEMAEFALEYRPSSSPFDQWSADELSPPGGVLVRLTPTLNTSGLSYLLDATPNTRQPYVHPSDDQFRTAWRDAGLRPGRTIRDTASGINIRVVTISSGTATVQLSGGPLGALPTTTPTPTATPGPTASPTPTATPAPTAPTASPTATPKPGATAVPTPTPTSTPGPTATPGPTVMPTPVSMPTPPAAGIVPTAPLVTQNDTVPNPALAPFLVAPAARKGVRKLSSSRKVTVSFPGAGQIKATYGKSWSRVVKRSRATFELPKGAVRKSTITFRASGGSLSNPRTASLRVRQGVLRFTTDS
ncbi:MAG: hypothetical protein J7513_03400 [Solirubrobacteraceae bacterium]|nr:hypothetical protein [Solirubrobacteraceae bacterium]